MSAAAETTARVTPGQGVIGLSLAGVMIAAWLGGHIYGVFFYQWTPVGIAVAPLLMAWQCWLAVGMFIVAHDAMHGSLAPDHPGLNKAVGALCLALYAGFSYNQLIKAHFAHHRHPGTALDPDFHADDPEHLWGWYRTFFLRYFGWRPGATILVVVFVYQVLLGASVANALVFWAVPSLLSSLQLFYFGTYLPHRREDEGFVDRHNARSNAYPWLLSLLTCFHFGYHHEHHLAPYLPWWRLPEIRKP